MSKYKVDVDPATDETTDVIESEADSSHDTHGMLNEDIMTKAVTVGAVVVGAAVIEAALIPGVLLGAAAMLAPNFLPKLSKSLNPICDATIRGVYKLGRKAQTRVSEMKEHMSDIAAEVKAEEHSSSVEVHE